MLIKRLVRSYWSPDFLTILYDDGREQVIAMHELMVRFGGIPYTIPPRRDAVALAVCHSTETGIDWIQVSGKYTTFRTTDSTQVRFHVDGTGDTYQLFSQGTTEYHPYLRDSSPSNLHHHQCECKKVWLCLFENCEATPHKDCIGCAGRHFLEMYGGRIRSSDVNSADQETSELPNLAGQWPSAPYSSERVHTVGFNTAVGSSWNTYTATHLATPSSEEAEVRSSDSRSPVRYEVHDLDGDDGEQGI